MKRSETVLPGVCVFEPDVFSDARGYFFESYHRDRFAELGIRDDFVQDNHSRSCRNVIRGLHYQIKSPQAKLCRVVEGEALDIAVDIRVGSPMYGKWTAVLLSATQHNLIYIPAGFAHGFVALSDSVQFLYKCSSSYDSGDEYGVAWNDPDLKITWGVKEPLLSERDLKLPRLAAVPKHLLPVYAP